jgi:hypothetical protein
LSGIQKDLGPKGFQVLAGAINDEPNIAGFIQQYNPPFPVGIANKLGAIQYMQIGMTERLPYVPYMVFIDRMGTIRAQYVGDDKVLDETQSDKLLRAEAEKLLNEGAAKPKPTRKAH